MRLALTNLRRLFQGVIAGRETRYRFLTITVSDVATARS